MNAGFAAASSMTSSRSLGVRTCLTSSRNGPNGESGEVLARSRLYAKSTATIDHTQRVVEQWNSEGNNEHQEPRADFYNDTGRMRIVAHKNNSSDGAMARRAGLRYQPNVGQNFRGPDDNP